MDGKKGNAIRSIAIITTQAFSMVNFRGVLIQALIKKNIKVYALAPDYTDDLREKIKEFGAIPVDFSLSRTGMNPVRDMLDVILLSRLLKRIKPDATFSYFVKAVIYGSAAAWFATVPTRFSMIEGLGYVFMDNKSILLHKRFLRYLLSFLFKITLRLNKKVFFLNDDDSNLFLKKSLVQRNQISKIDGIGVDLDYYSPVEPVVKPVSFILVARMLKEKGVYDFIEAARVVRNLYPETIFILVGSADLNPGSVQETELNTWMEEGLIKWIKHTNDVRPYLAKASVFVLPSYYREGLPRSTQEAMALGRPIITTDWVGCRETVENGVNGFLIPVKNPEALAQTMINFIESPELISKMGIESRKIAEERFNVHIINKKILEDIDI